MPQLNPSPWFLIFLLTWVIFIMISVTKVSKHYSPNFPTPKPYKNTTLTWTWPWP
uniref:ATP synthase complex subunit 8 n=1 Tax=Limnodynastes salmini TaxID=39404 RepID=S4V1R0_LIMSA|nr:ATP synthase F0 subunit 8 [Limnodynastes salmini]